MIFLMTFIFLAGVGLGFVASYEVAYKEQGKHLQAMLDRAALEVWQRESDKVVREEIRSHLIRWDAKR
jgi:hypothetical protein